MSGAGDHPTTPLASLGQTTEALGSEAEAEQIGAFPVLREPAVVHISKLTPEALAQCDLRDVEYVVIEPARGGVRLRPAGIEDQLKHEQAAGSGRITYSLGEFLDEFTTAPNHPAPTFDRLGQFKRDYVNLTVRQREQFRAAAKKFVAPLSTTPPGELGQSLVREVKGHPGFWELRIDRELRAIYTFGTSIRQGQPHVIWCRVGAEDALDRLTAVYDRVS
jgi:hypothetical protein